MSKGKPKLPGSENRLVSTAEAAKMLHINSHTLRYWGDKGILSYLQINSRGHRRYRLQDIELLLNAFNLWKQCLAP